MVVVIILVEGGLNVLMNVAEVCAAVISVAFKVDRVLAMSFVENNVEDVVPTEVLVAVVSTGGMVVVESREAVEEL